VNAALCGDVVAADRNQIVLVGAQPLNLGAQTLDHEVLQVDHAVAPPFHRRLQTVEDIRIAKQEIGMPTQICGHLSRRGFRCAFRFRSIAGAAGHVTVVAILAYKIDCPVFCQSERKAASPLSVNG
jgi:hypothetical protein